MFVLVLSATANIGHWVCIHLTILGFIDSFYILLGFLCVVCRHVLFLSYFFTIVKFVMVCLYGIHTYIYIYIYIYIYNVI